MNHPGQVLVTAKEMSQKVFTLVNPNPNIIFSSSNYNETPTKLQYHTNASMEKQEKYNGLTLSQSQGDSITGL